MFFWWGAGAGKGMLVPAQNTRHWLRRTGWGEAGRSPPAALGLCGHVAAEGWGRGHRQAGTFQRSKGRHTGSLFLPKKTEASRCAQQTVPSSIAGDPSSHQRGIISFTGAIAY